MSKLENDLCLVEKMIKERCRLDAENFLKQMLLEVTNNEDEAKVKDVLADLLQDMGYYLQSLNYRKECLNLFKSLKGEQSLDVLEQLLKMSHILWIIIDKVEEKSQVLAASQECLLFLSSTIKLLEQFPNYPDHQQIMSELKQRLLCTYFLDQNISKM